MSEREPLYVGTCGKPIFPETPLCGGLVDDFCAYCDNHEENQEDDDDEEVEE